MKTLDDLTAPRTYVKAQLESELQDQCVDWMRRRGYWARKFSSMSQRSVPDYLFAYHESYSIGMGEPPVVDRRIKFATEFKRPGTPPKPLTDHPGVVVMSTPAQWVEQQKMKAAGWFVFECDDLDRFKETVIGYERSQGVTL